MAALSAKENARGTKPANENQCWSTNTVFVGLPRKVRIRTLLETDVPWSDEESFACLVSLTRIMAQVSTPPPSNSAAGSNAPTQLALGLIVPCMIDHHMDYGRASDLETLIKDANLHLDPIHMLNRAGILASDDQGSAGEHSSFSPVQASCSHAAVQKRCHF